jgi:ParB-like chromosome segregation protein Spo0J
VSIQRTLESLKVAEVRQLPIASLKTDEALQPREDRMVPFREQSRVERRSEEHVAPMRLLLEAAQGHQLEPVLAAELDGRLFLVDGHHRLKAYRRAKRETIPARVLPMKRHIAVMVSKLVNCEARSLEMHAEQRRDAAWQYLAAVTQRGAEGLPEGESLRGIAGLFGISKDTVSSMLRKLPKVNPKGYPVMQLDPGTEWPRWKAVRDWKPDNEDDMQDSQMTLKQWTEKEAHRIARRLGALETGTTSDAWKLALSMYAEEARTEASNPDTLVCLREIAEYSDPIDPAADF